MNINASKLELGLGNSGPAIRHFHKDAVHGLPCSCSRCATTAAMKQGCSNLAVGPLVGNPRKLQRSCRMVCAHRPCRRHLSDGHHAGGFSNRRSGCPRSAGLANACLSPIRGTGQLSQLVLKPPPGFNVPHDICDCLLIGELRYVTQQGMFSVEKRVVCLCLYHGHIKCYANCRWFL